MKKIAFLLAFMVSCVGLHAQEYYLNLHQSGQVLFQNNVNEIENLFIQGNNPSSLFIQTGNGVNSFPLDAFDSITFVLQEPPQPGDDVAITFNGNAVSIVNPYANEGVSVTFDGADVTVNATRANVSYRFSGSSTNGSITLYSNAAYNLMLSDLDLTSSTKAPVNLATENNVTLTIEGSSVLTDNAYSSDKAAFCVAGNLTVEGEGTLQVTGYAKHGINVDGVLTVNSGEIDILVSDSDGIHANSNFYWNGGTLEINQPGSDGLDISGDLIIQDGSVHIASSGAESSRGIKVSGIFNMVNGHLQVTTTENDTKGIKCDSTVTFSGGVVEVYVDGNGSNGISSDTHISIEGTADITVNSIAYDSKCFKSDGTFSMSGGSIDLFHNGNISKGIKTVGDINISGGSITINAAGSTELQNVNNQNVPAYCSAIKSDNGIYITGGTFNITLPTSNHGGKAISADGNISISGGDFTIETNGDGAAYTVSGSTKDSYTSSCLKSDGNMELLAGTFNLTSNGKGGKGISAEGLMIIGTEGAPNEDLILNVTTNGERITVSQGGGGPWGGGDYANPKAIKSMGNLTINSGILRVNCTQTQNEGGECIESKAILTINNGDIEAYSKKDDAVNARTSLIINGGVYYAHSDANDGTDSNGTMQLNGGFNISCGSRSPEEGFDCDNNQFKITGGTHVGTGGGTSNPTSNVCTQPTLKINTMSNFAIQILKSDGTVICTYQCPSFTGGGGGWPGGGNTMVMLFTDPQLQTGQTYTIKYNGTISGGTNWNGYYTGNVTYTGGDQTNSFTINSMVTTVNAGSNGGGW